jgi:ferredoxin
VSAAVRAIQHRGRALLARADAAANALYTWRYNPLYHSGALVVASFVVLLATGLYLILFYRIGAPYASVERITGQVFTGQWIRTLHRYVSDVAIVAIVVHAYRMFVQDRAWGPRALAWVSGVVLTLAFLVCGWTGYVMVWDIQAQLFAAEGARLFDLLPIFSEPMGRTFVGERAIPSAFFFLNLFAHIAIPVGIAMVLWVHLSGLARTRILPPKRLFWGVVGLFTLVSVAWPLSMEPEADVLRLPTDVALDVFYGFWLPITQAMPAGWAWVAMLSCVAVALSVPLLTRPRAEQAPAPSYVNPRFCTGCEQCFHDCPYEAISMVLRDDGRDGYVGLVDPAKCVSCGICAGSCAPMGVGPQHRTGRDQIADVEAFISSVHPGRDRIVMVGCKNSAACRNGGPTLDADVFPVSCVGAVHTSVIEYLVRAGAGGVMVVTCPPRDCWNREGVVWFEERAFHQREAELKERVDRRRLRVVYAAEMESGLLARELASFQTDVDVLGDAPAPERTIHFDTLCEPPDVSVAEGAEA